MKVKTFAFRAQSVQRLGAR